MLAFNIFEVIEVPDLLSLEKKQYKKATLIVLSDDALISMLPVTARAHTGPVWPLNVPRQFICVSASKSELKTKIK